MWVTDQAKSNRHMHICKSMLLFLLCFTFLNCSGQNATAKNPGLKTTNPAFDKTIERYLSFSTPLISVDSLYDNIDAFHILDARESEEFEVSHLPTAQHIGYKKADWSVLDELNKDKDIVVYCSIGYRSEKISEKLIKKGYKVYNLYGSIFEWANRSYPLVTAEGTPTNSIHGYSKSWSKWVINDTLELVY